MTHPVEHQPAEVAIGRGRSGTVFPSVGPDGDLRVRKVFTGTTLSNIILIILTGAPNPYTWCRHAIASAFYTRRILAVLIRMWFGDLLRLPESHSYYWDAERRAFALETELIRGRHVAIRHPFSWDREWELRELQRRIMSRLQLKLKLAGFDGLVWQAGMGNPVASNNYMIEHDANGRHTWVCIDLESGVPALFPMNVLRLFSYYLPASFKHGQPLFDHVDLARLRKYIHRKGDALRAHIGEKGFEKLMKDVRKLAAHQHLWRAMPRMYRGIEAEAVRGVITRKDARWFRRHPISWNLWVVRKLIAKVIDLAARGLRKIARFIDKLPVARLMRLSIRFISSHNFRARCARFLVLKRTREWIERKQLTHEEGMRLKEMLKQESSSTYLADFAVHLALRPIAKFTAFVAIPFLIYQSRETLDGEGIIFVVSAVLTGPAYRTLYTGWRTLTSFLRGDEIPWVALIVGMIPSVGNAAYPLQLMYASGGAQRPLPQFMICDAVSLVGEFLPVWGGRDTLVEHAFNRIGARVAGLGPARETPPLRPAQNR
jgi:hypothetical protein